MEENDKKKIMETLDKFSYEEIQTFIQALQIISKEQWSDMTNMSVRENIVKEINPLFMKVFSKIDPNRKNIFRYIDYAGKIESLLKEKLLDLNTNNCVIDFTEADSSKIIKFLCTFLSALHEKFPQIETRVENNCSLKFVITW